MTNCCNLVGDLRIDVPGIVSIGVSSDTESSWIEGELVIGPTIGKVSVSAYASPSVHCACPGRASVTIPWIKKLDCDAQKVYFIFSGQGRSTISGDVGGMASIVQSLGRDYTILNANASSGPTVPYEQNIQHDGYGLSYSGGPWSFTTSEEYDVMVGSIGSIAGPLYLESFSLECSPGSIPTVSYSFAFAIT